MPLTFYVITDGDAAVLKGIYLTRLAHVIGDPVCLSCSPVGQYPVQDACEQGLLHAELHDGLVHRACDFCGVND